MDRTAWIVVTLCTLGLGYWFWTLPKHTPPPPRPTVDATQAAAKPAAESGTAEKPAEPAKVADTTPKVAESTFDIDQNGTRATFTNLGGGLKTLALPPHHYAGDDETLMNREGVAAVGTLSRSAGDTEDGAYELKSPAGQTPVVYERLTPDGLLIRKTWTPVTEGEGKGFLWKLQLTLKNQGAAKFAGTYGVYAGTAAPLRKADNPVAVAWNADGQAKDEPVSWFDGGSGFLGMKFGSPSSTFTHEFQHLLWAGVHSQYYTTLVANTAPEKDLPAGTVWAQRRNVDVISGEKMDKGYAIYAAFGLPPLAIEPGAEQTFDLEIYMGPRAYSILKHLDRRYGEVMFYGWWSPISRAMLWLLVHLERLFSWTSASWGLAIVLLTLIVRGLMWPLNIKSMRSMKRMSLLAPQMKELQEKHKDNPQKMNTEVMGLYRKYGVNPVSGCLPMFLQIPIFFGLYRMLQSAVELRGHGFLWVNDLSLPDIIPGLHVFGVTVNPLPIVMGITMFIQMLMTPKSPDPNMQQQQKIFMFMPFMFLYFCYNFAAALALYWTVSNLLGILQSWIMKKLPEPELRERALAGGGTGGKGGKPSFGEVFAQRLAEHQKKAAKSSVPRTGGGAGSVYKKKERQSDD